MQSQILRTYEGDEWNYTTINDDDQEVLLGLTEFDAMCYCNWIENGSLFENDDEAVALASTEYVSYELTTAPVHQSSNDSPLMMSGSGKKGPRRLEKTDSPNIDNPIIEARENSDNSSRASFAGLSEGGQEVATRSPLANHDVQRFLRNEINNNIYAACLAEVAALTLQDRVATEGTFRHEAEKIAGKTIVELDKSLAEIEESEAKMETAAAKEEAKTAEEEFKKAMLRATDSETAIHNLLYYKKYKDYSTKNYEVKKLNELLATAKVKTAIKKLREIILRDNESQYPLVKAELDAALENERAASSALDEKNRELAESKEIFLQLSLRPENDAQDTSDVIIQSEQVREQREQRVKENMERKQQWMQAKAAAGAIKEVANINLIRAIEEREKAEEHAKKEKKATKKVLTKPTNKIGDRIEIYANIMRQEASEAHAISDYFAKQCYEEFARAKLNTAIASIEVILVRDNTEQCEIAKKILEEAKEAEQTARDKYEIAKSDVSIKEIQKEDIAAIHLTSDDETSKSIHSPNIREYECNVIKGKIDEYLANAQRARAEGKEYSYKHWSGAVVAAQSYFRSLESHSYFGADDWQKLLQEHLYVVSQVKAAEAYPTSMSGYFWP